MQAHLVQEELLGLALLRLFSSDLVCCVKESSVCGVAETEERGTRLDADRWMLSWSPFLGLGSSWAAPRKLLCSLPEASPNALSILRLLECIKMEVWQRQESERSCRRRVR